VLGGTPSFRLTQGFVITPANLVTQALINTLCTMPQSMSLPKIITISSTGLTKTSHASLPLLLKPIYGYLLASPHRDKVGTERVIAHCAGWKWNSKVDGEPSEDIMGKAWTERPNLPAPGSLSKNVLVVRPALLTDGICKADTAGKKAYRVAEPDIKGWTVSRKDVAHFVVDAVQNRWDEYAGKCVSIAY
jgi:hypothetical protein